MSATCNPISNAVLKPVTSTTGPYQLQSLDRVIGMLEVLGESDRPLSLAEICRRLSIHKSTAHRALMVLERSTLLERTADNRFRLGLKLHELGNRAIGQMELSGRAHPYFRKLADSSGETLHMGVLQKTSIVYLDKVEPVHRVRMSSRIGVNNPVYCTAMGKAMLAFQPAEVADQILGKIRFVRYTAKTISTRDALERSLERTRRRGYAIDDEEIEVGVRCIGAPILNEHRQPIAAVSISGSTARISPEAAPELAQRLLRCCREISVDLQGQQSRRHPHVDGDGKQ